MERMHMFMGVSGFFHLFLLILVILLWTGVIGTPYVTTMDQKVHKKANVEFNSLTLEGIPKDSRLAGKFGDDNSVLELKTNTDNVTLGLFENSGSPELRIKNGDKTIFVADSDGHVAHQGSLVTQATSATTGVTHHTRVGTIRTQSLSTAADAATTFTVTNKYADTNKTIICNLSDYSGTLATNGLPVATVSNKTAGAFNISIYNPIGANALSGTADISYMILD